MHKHRSHHRAVRPRATATAPAPSGPVRVGDADRERVVELLRGHAVAGRLDADELDERLGRAYAARYGAELQAALAELPSEPALVRRPARRSRPHTPLALFPIPLAALIAVAAVSGAWWLMWLIWPLVVVLGPRRQRRWGTRL